MKSLLNRDGEVFLYKKIFPYDYSILEKIKSEVIWRDDKITMFGKTYPQARKVAWHGKEGITYTYTRIKMVAPGWTPTLKKLTDEVNSITGGELNTALVNYYRNGKDHMSWHRDDEPELGEEPLIASLNFGASREFFFRHNDGEKVGVTLEHGDLLIMQGKTQDYWKHALPKRLKVSEPRLNITLRKIIQL